MSKGSHTISCLLKAVSWVAVTGEDYNLVSPVLEANSSIDDQPFSTSNAEIRV